MDFDVVPLSQLDDDFSSWTNRFFTFAELDDPDLFSDLADPDNDGLNNVAEYFFGLHPRQTNYAPKIGIANYDGASLSFTYPRSQIRPDLIMRLEGSNALKDWVSLATTGISVTPIDEDFETVAMNVAWPFDPDFPRFIRLTIEQTE